MWSCFYGVMNVFETKLMLKFIGKVYVKVENRTVIDLRDIKLKPFKIF